MASEATGKLPVVYPPTWISWDVMKQRPQYLLEVLAGAGHPVRFVGGTIPDRPVPGVEFFGTIDELPAERSAVYIHYAPLVETLDRFEDPVVIYDILDDLTLFEGDEPDGERKYRDAHLRMLETADIVIASNPILAERNLDSRDDVLLVPNGVDTEAFSTTAPRPEDLPDAGPVIGYHGMVSHWFDFDAVSRLARSRPEWRIAIVGPADERVRHRLDSLCAIGNVLWFGERDAGEMPGFAQAFDVGLIPFVVTPMTEGVTPLKLYEYLAAGTPVVSSELPACRGLSGVSIAGEKSWVEAVEAQLTRGRIDPDVAGADWRSVAEPLLRRLGDFEINSGD